MADTERSSSKAIVVSDFTVTTAVGRGRAALRDALANRRGALKPCEFAPRELQPFGRQHRIETFIGEVDGVDDVQLPAALADYDCRNNRLAWLALQQDGMFDAARQLCARYGAQCVALVLGTSTSGLMQVEWAYHARNRDGLLPSAFRYRETLNCFSAAAFVAAATGIAGPASMISTACSSSAKVFAAAARLIRANLADAALVGGVDSLCLTTLSGFGSLELLSREACRPYAVDRSGISIGEGAGFAILERAPQARRAVAQLAGWGESSDAFHMSTPHPDGLGAQLAIRAALERAGIGPREVGYINLHGTATRTNDAAEAHAVHAVFGDAVPTSSTKAWFGHLLGAAGIAEAAVTLTALTEEFAPGTLNTPAKDPACPNHLLIENEALRFDVALSNSFGFGGSNCTLAFRRFD